MGEFKNGFFWGLGGSPRGDCEEGGQLVFTLCAFGGIYWELSCEWGDLWMRGEGFEVKEGS
jgi:hypothetical protein